MIYFTKTSIGYSHQNSGKVCQDFSASYHDKERTIITACDGHGGRAYLRSELGSKFASDAIIRAFSRLKLDAFNKLSEDIADSLRINILCEWNAMVEQSMTEKPVTTAETSQLSEEERLCLFVNPARAYGTTLNGAMILDDKLVCAGLGDGGVFLIFNGEITPAFAEDENEPVANITYSLCQEDACKYLKIGVFDAKSIDGVLICTDGLVNPYQNLANFNQSFVRPVCSLALDGKLDEIENFVVKLATEIGIGDDVSLGLILKQDASPLLKQNKGESNDVSTGIDDGTANG